MPGADGLNRVLSQTRQKQASKGLMYICLIKNTFGKANLTQVILDIKDNMLNVLNI